MTKERRNELDSIIAEYTTEFKDSESFGVLYMSCDEENGKVSTCLESPVELLGAMIYSLMKSNMDIAEEILESAALYMQDLEEDNEPDFSFSKN